MKDDLIYIEHILNCIVRIESYISDVDHISFINDFMLQDAVVRQLEIIGEVTKRISQDFRKKYQDIPWSDMAGMRDVLIHDYVDMDLDIVWKTVTENIPILKANLIKIV